jgi:hypothetical protein
LKLFCLVSHAQHHGVQFRCDDLRRGPCTLYRCRHKFGSFYRVFEPFGDSLASGKIRSLPESLEDR